MKSRAYKLSLISLGIILMVWVFFHSSELVSPLELPPHSAIKLFARWILTVIPMTVALLLLHKPKFILESTGLNGNILKGFGFALLCTLPLYAGFPFFGNINTDITLETILYRVVIAAFFEEVAFRGFMFGQLFRYGQIGFFWAALFPALLFGSAHIYQGHDLVSSLSVFAITFFGALYFSWIYVEWDFNIWMPIGLHFFMNLSWQMFIIEGNEVAAGGLISNILRIISIVLAIIITILHKRKSKKRIFDYPVWSIR